MYLVSNVRLELDENNIKNVLANKLGVKEQDILSYKFYKKAIDSRNKNHIFFLCHFIVDVKKKIKNKDVIEYTPYTFNIDRVNKNEHIVVVGMGPAGLFASYVLALSGVRVTLIERGKKVEDRINDVNAFFNEGKLNIHSNMQYGEGGAGTFSDGKLNTNINDKRIDFIKETFVKFGAHEDILYMSKPHIGSDVLFDVMKNFRKELLKLGVDIKYRTTLKDLSIKNDELEEIVLLDNDSNNTYKMPCKKLILATGHSARDIYYMLDRKGVELVRKPFSIGVRIEHLQENINLAQYGEKYYKHPALGSADYKLAIHLGNGRSLYTFCNCPGGVVVATSSEDGEIVTNGMSYNARNMKNCNSALLVNVEDSDLPDGLFGGIEFQKKYERLAYELSGDYHAPCQLVKDLYDNKESVAAISVNPSYKPGVIYTNLSKCLPKFVINTLKEGLPLLDRKVKGFNDPEALLIGPETRSSSPLRIVRDENYETNIKGIYPSGEGSGYSSGITTSALDGIRVALRLIEIFNK